MKSTLVKQAQKDLEWIMLGCPVGRGYNRIWFKTNDFI